MIFLAAGTQDARQVAEALLKNGYHVTASVVSSYGKILLSGHKNLTILEQMLDEKAMQQVLLKNKIKIFVDASHPYAVNISKTAMLVCAKLGITYFRYERPVTPLPDYDKLYKVTSFEEAAQKADDLGSSIFLTTGSRHLTEFTSVIKPPKLLTVRVLPAVESIQACIDAGFLPKYIIGMQGPFSEEMNRLTYQHTKADVIVMKNSGKLGGSDTKLTAAINDKLAIVVIDRPQLDYKNLSTDIDVLIDKIKETGEK